MANLLTLTAGQPLIELAAGEVLIKEGELGGDLFILEAGQLVVSRDGIPLATVSNPGAALGEMSVLLGTEHTATVTAEEPSRLRVVPDAFAYLERHPLAALRIAMLVTQRLDKTSALLVALRHETEGRPSEQAMLQRIAGVVTA